MNFFTFSLFLLALCSVIYGATISRTESEDSYLNKHIDDDDIKENLIQDEDAGDIIDLLPPKADAKDYYAENPEFYRKSSYNMNGDVMSYIAPAETEQPMTMEEEVSAKQISAAINQLLTKAKDASGSDDPFKTVVINADDSKPGDVSEADMAAEVTTMPNGEPETFTTDDSTPTGEARNEEETGLFAFFQSLWDVVQESVSVAARMITTLGRRDDSTDSTTAAPETTTAAPVSSTSSAASSAGPIAAFEEPLAHHSLPAHEFDNRRDIDSLLYGRGIA